MQLAAKKPHPAQRAACRGADQHACQTSYAVHAAVDAIIITLDFDPPFTIITKLLSLNMAACRNKRHLLVAVSGLSQRGSAYAASMSRNSPSLSHARAARPGTRAVISLSSQATNHSSSRLSPNCTAPHRQGRRPSLNAAKPPLLLPLLALPDRFPCLQGGCWSSLLVSWKVLRCQM